MTFKEKQKVIIVSPFSTTNLLSEALRPFLSRTPSTASRYALLKLNRPTVTHFSINTASIETLLKHIESVKKKQSMTIEDCKSEKANKSFKELGVLDKGND